MKVSGGIVRGDEEDSNEEDNAIWKGKKEEWRGNSGERAVRKELLSGERESGLLTDSVFPFLISSQPHVEDLLLSSGSVTG